MNCLDEDGVRVEQHGNHNLTPRGEAACSCNCEDAVHHQCMKTQDPSHAAPESTVKDPTEQPECWICFGSGTPVSTAAIRSHADDSEGASLVSTTDALDAAATDPDDHTPHCSAHCSSSPGSPGSEALVAPCALCRRGSVGWVHRRCLSRWLHTCWSFSCPNCTRPLERSVLATLPAGRLWGSLLSGLEASRTGAAALCSADTGAELTFPPGALVCLELPGYNGHVRFTIPSAHCTATEVARRIGYIVGGLQDADADAEALLRHASLQVQQQQQRSSGSGPGDVTASLISPPPPGASPLHSAAQAHASRVDALMIWQRLLSLHQSPPPSAPGPEAPAGQLMRGTPDSSGAHNLGTPSSQGTTAFHLPLHLAAGAGVGLSGADAPPQQLLQPSPGADPSGRRAWVRQQLDQQGQGRAAAAVLQQALGSRAGDVQAQGPASSRRSPLWTLRDPPSQRPVQRHLQDTRRVNGRRRC